MFHLKLATIYLQQILTAAVEDFSERFDSTGLPRPSGTKQQHNPDGAPFGCKTRLLHLNVWNDRLDSFWLPNKQFVQLSG
jgi:hypothetical protein